MPLGRAVQRKIAPADAEAVYLRHDTERPGEKPGTRLLIGTIGLQRIKIVVDDRGPAIKVITVADTEADDEN
jgi:hypothetical protein